MRPQMRRLTWLGLLLAVVSFASTAHALELVMFRRAGCPWCATWDREIGAIYGKTDVSRRAPVRFIDLDRVHGTTFALRSPVRFTPTFVLVDEDREIGRIVGVAEAEIPPRSTARGSDLPGEHTLGTRPCRCDPRRLVGAHRHEIGARRPQDDRGDPITDRAHDADQLEVGALDGLVLRRRLERRDAEQRGQRGRDAHPRHRIGGCERITTASPGFSFSAEAVPAANSRT